MTALALFSRSLRPASRRDASAVQCSPYGRANATCLSLETLPVVYKWAEVILLSLSGGTGECTTTFHTVFLHYLQSDTSCTTAVPHVLDGALHLPAVVARRSAALQPPGTSGHPH
jgi:hypothetical protein